MATSSDAPSGGMDSYDVAGSGWLTFAATLLGLAGTFNIIDGIVGLSKSKFFTANATYVFSDLRTWSWILLVLGVLQVIAAFSLFGGSEWARWFGIVTASLNAIGQLLASPGYPLWSLTMFAIDIVIIYALAVYAGHKLRT
ncbi:MAG: hypothetical protein WB462_05270 [Solirubrobacterales bacterium]